MRCVKFAQNLWVIGCRHDFSNSGKSSSNKKIEKYIYRLLFRWHSTQRPLRARVRHDQKPIFRMINMKIFKNLAQALLSVALVSQASAFAVTVPEYARTIVDTQDYAWPVAFPEDPFHAGMIASGLYTQADADAMDDAAAADFLALYGWDFNPVTNPNVVVDPTNGRRTIPGLPAIWFDYISENQAFVVNDTQYPPRGKSQYWVNNKYGIQILFIGPTTGTAQFTAGVNAGASYRANNLFSFGEFNYMKLGADPSKPNNREVISYTTTNLSYSSTNQWGQGQFTVTLKLTDQDGNVGKYIGTTEIYKDPLGASGTNYLRENPVSTWETLTN
jgi:hypothetical protein